MINKNEIEILVVDDDEKTAKSVADFITSELSIQAEGVSTPDEAIEIVKTGNVKVAVLDQVMPEKSGIELYKYIHHINKYIQGILFSGQSDGDDVAKGYKAGIEFMNKRDLKDLPTSVYNAYVKYHTSLKDIKVAEKKPLYSYISWNLRNLLHHTDIYLLDTIIVNKQFHFDNWTSVVELDSEKLETDITIEYEEDTRMETDYEDRFKAEIGIGKKLLPILTGKIIQYINNTYNISKKYNIRQKQTVRKIYEKPQKTAGSLVVVKRVYERVPLYIEYSVILCTVCSFCGKKNLTNVKVYQRIPRNMTRTLDYVEGRTEPIVNETGIIG